MPYTIGTLTRSSQDEQPKVVVCPTVEFRYHTDDTNTCEWSQHKYIQGLLENIEPSRNTIKLDWPVLTRNNSFDLVCTATVKAITEGMTDSLIQKLTATIKEDKALGLATLHLAIEEILQKSSSKIAETLKGNEAGVSGDHKEAVSVAIMSGSELTKINKAFETTKQPTFRRPGNPFGFFEWLDTSSVLDKLGHFGEGGGPFRVLELSHGEELESALDMTHEDLTNMAKNARTGMASSVHQLASTMDTVTG